MFLLDKKFAKICYYLVELNNFLASFIPNKVNI